MSVKSCRSIGRYNLIVRPAYCNFKETTHTPKTCTWSFNVTFQRALWVVSHKRGTLKPRVSQLLLTVKSRVSGMYLCTNVHERTYMYDHVCTYGVHVPTVSCIHVFMCSCIDAFMSISACTCVYIEIYIYIYTLWLFNIAMENGPFIDDFPIKTSIYKGFSMAMLNNQRVYIYIYIYISANVCGRLAAYAYFGLAPSSRLFRASNDHHPHPCRSHVLHCL